MTWRCDICGHEGARPVPERCPRCKSGLDIGNLLAPSPSGAGAERVCTGRGCFHLRDDEGRAVGYYHIASCRAQSTPSTPETEGERDVELAFLRRELFTARDMLRGDYWLWQGDGADDLGSLVCPVVIRPDVLAALLASHPAPERERVAEEALQRISAVWSCTGVVEALGEFIQRGIPLPNDAARRLQGAAERIREEMDWFTTQAHALYTGATLTREE